MINTAIKVYKNLVEVDVTDFNWGIEKLYWEWKREDFQEKYETQDSIIFPMHDGKVRKCTRIIWFDNARSNDNSLQHKIARLEIDIQEQIKMKVKVYKKEFGKYPSNEWVDNVIDHILHPDKSKMEEFKKMQEGEKIRDLKKKRIDFFSWLEETQRKLILKKAWDKVCEINPKYCDNKENIYAKSLFITAKNEIIDNLLNDVKKGN